MPFFKAKVEPKEDKIETKYWFSQDSIYKLVWRFFISYMLWEF